MLSYALLRSSAVPVVRSGRARERKVPRKRGSASAATVSQRERTASSTRISA